MATISCDINTVISYLIDCMNEGYTSVELIDDARAAGWRNYNGETLTFIMNKNEPGVLGIDARSKRK